MTKVAIFNAEPDTGNLGVTALGYSVIAGLARRMSNLSLTVADSGFGIRSDAILVDGIPFPFQRCGFRFSKRLYLSESYWNVRLAAKFGGAWNSIARHLLSQDFALDITGGDSFTDLYGPKRFNTAIRTKTFFLDKNIPLGLLPQTYGPFQDPRHYDVASKIVQRSRFAWARDERSFRVLRDMAGDKFDAELHRGGVDVAFLLDVIDPPEGVLDSRVSSWLSDSSHPTVGINVSGLIYNNPEAAVGQYGFVADYRELITRFVQQVLEQGQANILLIPHVVVPPGHFESDIAACQSVAKALEHESHGRIAVLPALNDPRQVKWVISKCDWFCGTRMHATIAALSTGVPTAAVAYSIKTAGVFETCGQGEHVADPRELSTQAMIDRLWQSWLSRERSRDSLSVELPSVLDQARLQMDEIAEACQGRKLAVSTEMISQ